MRVLIGKDEKAQPITIMLGQVTHVTLDQSKEIMYFGSSYGTPGFLKIKGLTTEIYMNIIKTLATTDYSHIVEEDGSLTPLFVSKVG